MMKIWNPVEAYRKASQHNKNEQIRHEAKSKICIGDYTDSKGVTYTALMIDGIPVQRITADNIVESELLLDSVRKEYFKQASNRRIERRRVCHHDKEAQGSVHQMGRDAARFHNPIARGANRGFEGFPTVEPTIRRGNDGVSSWVDNLSISFGKWRQQSIKAYGKWRQQSIKAYGNAWVPQVAYEIFRAIELITKQQTEQ